MGVLLAAAKTATKPTAAMKEAEKRCQRCSKEGAGYKERRDLTSLESEAQGEGREEEFEGEGPGGNRTGTLEHFGIPFRAQVQVVRRSERQGEGDDDAAQGDPQVGVRDGLPAPSSQPLGQL